MSNDIKPTTSSPHPPRGSVSARRIHRLEHAKVTPLLIRLSIPATMSMMIQATYSLVDGIFIGRYSKEGLTAIAVAFPFQMVIIGIGLGVGVGSASVLSRLLGMKRKELAASTFEHAIGLSLVGALFCCLVMGIPARQLLGIFISTSSILDTAVDYFRIILLSTFVQLPQMTMNHIFRVQGNAILPLALLAVGTVSNIILDPLLIYGIGPFPELGVRGAALATILGRCIALIFLYFIMKRLHLAVKPNLRHIFFFKASLVKQIAAVGIPTFLMQGMAFLMLAVLNLILEDVSGDVAVAVGGVWFRLQTFSTMPSYGVAQGFAAIFGFAYGAKRKARMKEVFLKALLAGALVVSVSTTVFLLFPRAVVSMFSTDKEVLDMGEVAVSRAAFGLLFVSQVWLMQMALQFQGMSWASMLCSFLKDFVWTLPLAWWFATLGKNDVWYGLSVGPAMGAVTTWVIFIYKERKVFKDLDKSVDESGLAKLSAAQASSPDKGSDPSSTELEMVVLESESVLKHRKEDAEGDSLTEETDKVALVVESSTTSEQENDGKADSEDLAESEQEPASDLEGSILGEEDVGSVQEGDASEAAASEGIEGEGVSEVTPSEELGGEEVSSETPKDLKEKEEAANAAVSSAHHDNFDV